VVVQKTDVNRVDAQAVGQDVVAERIVTDNTLMLRINSGQPDDVTERTGCWQLRVMEVSYRCYHEFGLSTERMKEWKQIGG